MNALQPDAGVQPDPECRTLITELEKLLERWLRPHIDRIRCGAVQPRPKVINDALWGSIRLHAWEVAILDSYLLQRLRFLRQLGVVHWVYPSAGHSRLEHSLGVLHQMDALIEGLERNSGRAGIRIIDDVAAKLLRIAALVHDCGHCAMSHVPEQIIAELPGVAGLVRYVKSVYRPRKRPSPSEAFAAVFIRSPAFHELLSLPAVGADFIKDINGATKQIAGFLLGGPVVPDRAFLTLLVNGSFDADKLDYMPRDCLMAGVPCAVDVRRVIEIIRCVEVPIPGFPRLEEYAKWAGLQDSQSVKILTLSSSGGARALDELAMTRAVLYDKIYYHQKVRALEVMVRRWLRDIGPRSVSAWLELVDEEILSGATRKAVSPLRERRLLKRALTIASPTEGDKDLERNWRALTLPGEKERLKAVVQEEAKEIATLLGIGTHELDEQAVEVDFPDIKRIELDMNTFVGDSVDEVSRANAVMGAQRPEAGKRAARQVMYVFAPERAVLPVFLATRTHLVERYKIPVNSAAYRATRIDPEAIIAAEEKLTAAGHHKIEVSDPVLQRRIISHREAALEAFLKTAWPRLETLSWTFGRYQSQGSPPVSPARIAEYLRQFGTEARARSALRLLEDVDFKDRAFFAGALKSRLEAALGLGPVAFVCPFGETGDSSALLAYLMADIPKELRRPVVPLELALESDDEGALLLWDDFCGAAGHSKTALTQWLGISDSEILDEALVRQLSAERSESFRSRKIVITFALARSSGIKALRIFLDKHSLFNVKILDPHEPVGECHDLFSSSRVIPDEAARTDIKEFLEVEARRGFETNLTRANPWTREKLERRLLGYGNGAHLLVFFYNVPTVTLTALWSEGQSPSSWRPLFPRRSKPFIQLKPSPEADGTTAGGGSSEVSNTGGVNEAPG